MTITQKWEVVGDSNEYNTKEEAILAEKIQDANDIYIESHQRKRIITCICKYFWLTPKQGPASIAPTREGYGREDPAAELNSWGASA